MRRIRSTYLVLPGLLCGCFSPNAASTSGGEGENESTGATGTTAPGPTTTGDVPTTVDTSGADVSTTDGPPDTTESSGDVTGDTDSGPVCGNGVVEGSEVCDDGVNDGNYGGCFGDCSQLGAHCGDEIVQRDEVCDDGNGANGDGCNIDCIESGSVIWTRTFGTSTAYGVAVAADDGVAVINFDAEFQRYDVAGNPGWNASYDVPSSNTTFGQGVAYQEDVGWLFVGQASTASQGYNVWWRVVGDDAAPGETGTYDGASHTNDFIGGVAFDTDGGFAISWESLDADYDHYVRRFNAAGDPLWTQSFDNGGDDRAAAVAIDSGGNVIVGGSSEVNNQATNGWLRKYDPQGATLWTRTFTGDDPSSDWIDDIAIGPSGEIAVVGNLRADIFTRLYDNDGAEQWTAIHDGPVDGPLDDVCQVCLSFDAGGAVAIDSVGAVVVAGSQIVGAEDGDSETWVRKYDEDGDELWTWSGGPAQVTSQAAGDIAVDGTDHVIVVGNWAGQAWVQKFAP